MILQVVTRRDIKMFSRILSVCARALGVNSVRASQSRGVCIRINKIIELHLLSTAVICSEASWVGGALNLG